MDKSAFTVLRGDKPVSFCGIAPIDSSGFPFFYDANCPSGEVSLMALILHNTAQFVPHYDGSEILRPSL